MQNSKYILNFIYSDSSQEDEFSFGMDIYDDFDSDSDVEAGNLVKEMIDYDFDLNNEQLLRKFSQLHISLLSFISWTK